MTDHETIDPVAREISKAARIAEAIVSGKADLAEARGLSARDLNYVYSCAYTYYQSGDYTNALLLFQFLTLHRQTDVRYWMGLGATLQMLGRHDVALQAYGVCATLDPADPQVPLRAGECFLQRGDNENARNALEAAILVAGDSASHAPIVARARTILAGLTKGKQT